ncbi:MAG: class I SAM-dependent methyltransferase [Gammaproteobacteria bacterium]|nr:class I SAM-dependent methyltransferase [Gammaproteobacteria bacterium]
MFNTQKPYSESCDENAQPILDVLKTKLPELGNLLEIGSGTGQHAVIFARSFPKLNWHTSDVNEAHAGIQLWLDEFQLDNLLSPIPLDVLNDQWPDQKFDAIFTANTSHIMSQQAVEAMFKGVSSVLKADVPFLTYGPFMYNGKHTSESNVRFDHWLRTRAQHQGVRDVSWLKELATNNGLYLDEDIEMPANNRILVWRLK